MRVDAGCVGITLMLPTLTFILVHAVVGVLSHKAWQTVALVRPDCVHTHGIPVAVMAIETSLLLALIPVCTVAAISSEALFTLTHISRA